MTEAFRVRVADWQDDGPALQAVRMAVFVREQQVPETLEWDGLDTRCRHVIAESDHGEPIGCGRLRIAGDQAHIGRMAVSLRWRGRGVGRALLQTLIAQAEGAGCHRAMLNAQTHALGFYEREGFTAHGPIFDDAGIAHRAMQRDLKQIQPEGDSSSANA